MNSHISLGRIGAPLLFALYFVRLFFGKKEPSSFQKYLIKVLTFFVLWIEVYLFVLILYLFKKIDAIHYFAVTGGSLIFFIMGYGYFKELNMEMSN